MKEQNKISRVVEGDLYWSAFTCQETPIVLIKKETSVTCILLLMNERARTNIELIVQENCIKIARRKPNPK